MNNEDKIIDKIQCPECVKLGHDLVDKNNLCIYSDGHGYCHAREHYFKRHELPASIQPKEFTKTVLQQHFIGTFGAIEERGVSQETCKLLGIMSNADEIAFLYDNGVKIRKRHEKKFYWLEGDPQECSMFGLAQAKDYSKPIILTEGENDTASCYEVGYQACSVRSGAKDIEKSIQHDLQELLKYKEIWLGLDNDEEGQKATEKALKLLPKAKIISLTNKDANEGLLDNTLKEDLDAFEWEESKSKREGLIFGNELDFNQLQSSPIKSIELPWPKLNESLGGLDYGCFYLILAGVGIGKSTLLNELSYYYYDKGHKIANLFYEENEEVTPLRYIALKHNIPVGKLRRKRDLITAKDWDNVKDIFKDSVCFLGKNALRNSDKLIDYIEYLVEKKEFKLIIIDHISYIIGRSGISKNGERRDIDELIYRLQDLTQRLGCIIIAVSHITESTGTKGWDDGEIPSLYSGRGSKVLAQVPDGIIGLARNMKNEYNQSIMTLYNLKNRWGGTLGKMDSLVYYDNTGRLEVLNE